MKRILFIIVAVFSITISSYADRQCPWCRGCGIYNAPAISYTSEGTNHECALCGKAYNSRIGHSCRCSKCNGTGYITYKSGISTPRQRSTDYSGDIMYQNMDWENAELGCLYTGNPCGLVRGVWSDRNTAFAQFQIRQPMTNQMYQWYGGLIERLATKKANELSSQYRRKIRSVVELYDYRGTLLKRVIR